jgi:hypothetical protein
MAAPNKGMSAKRIERLLGLSYKSAWFVYHRIRAALREDTAGPIGGAADETCAGRDDKNAMTAKSIS